MNHLLVVCLGNICRSPIAEALLKKELPNCSISSAGLTTATEGWMADPSSVRVMHEQNMDITMHRARPITSKMVQEANLILVMEFSQVKAIENRFPNAKGKVMRLGHYLNCDISDPFNQSLDVFYKTYDVILKSVQTFVLNHPNL